MAMAYEPNNDPFLMQDDVSVISGGGRPQPNGYQYQPQSMYQMPVNGQPQTEFPQNYPPNQQARRLKPKQPSQYNPNGAQMMPPPGPILRQTPSFYADPMMGPPPMIGSPMIGQPVMGQPMMGAPYVVPPQPYGYSPAAVAMAAPVYVQGGGAPYGGDTRYMINQQVDEMNRYQGSRTGSYHSGGHQDNSLLIATLVSEQDAMYGTNMLENLTPADHDYIQSMMQRGVPEPEAYRLNFERRPRIVRPPKVVGESHADKKALEDAIQASLTESSRRASLPDNHSSGTLADEEALAKAIELSLLESRNASSTYRSAADYTNADYYSGQTTSSNTAMSRGASYENEYLSEEERRGYTAATTTASTTRPYDRQYPYNLSMERPVDTLSRPKPVNHMTEEDYTKARLMREAEDIRARAYGGGASTAGSYSNTESYQGNSRGQYRDGRYDDDYSVDSRASRGSRSIDDRSQYSYDRPGPGGDARYTQQERTTTSYSASSHSHAVPALAYSAYSNAPTNSSNHPPHLISPRYRTEDADYDSQSEEGKDDVDYRHTSRAPISHGHSRSRSSNFTSTSSISAPEDSGEYTPRSREDLYNRSPLRHTSHETTRAQSPPSYRSGSPNSGGVRLANLAVASDNRYADNSRVQSTTSTTYTTRVQAVTQAVSNRSRSPSPALSRVPSFVSPPNSARSASPAPGAGLARVPSFTSSSHSSASGSGAAVPSLTRVPSFAPPRMLPPHPPSRSGIAQPDSPSTSTSSRSGSGSGSVAPAAASTDPTLPQHEWRKTLTRLVSKLTIDSDSEGDEK